jgi:hypothetical protein
MRVLPALHKVHTVPSPRHEPGTWKACSLNSRRQSDRREQEGSLRAASPGIASRCHPTGFASFPKNCPRRRGGSSLSARSLTICSFLCLYCRRHFLELQSVAESESLSRNRIPTATHQQNRPPQPLHYTYLRLDPGSLGRDLSLQPALRHALNNLLGRQPLGQ